MWFMVTPRMESVKDIKRPLRMEDEFNLPDIIPFLGEMSSLPL